MANYKLVDAARLDAALATVADAIRSKTGVKNLLAFPQDFASEIAAIEAAPVLTALEVTENGAYVPGDGIDGFSSVTVQVSGDSAKPFDCHSVTFMHGDEVLYVRSVVTGDTCADPIDKGFIDTPAIPETEDYFYTFTGWGSSDGGTYDSTILQNITADKVVYACFSTTYKHTVIGSGTTSDGLTWKVTAGGTLTISGSGAMMDYSVNDAPPWRTSYQTFVKALVIEEGVTKTGQCCFYKMHNIASISLPASLTYMRPYTFAYVYNTPTVTVPAAVTGFDGYVFFKMTGLETLYFENPTGWYTSARDMTTEEMSDPATAATLAGSTYATYIWYRNTT